MSISTFYHDIDGFYTEITDFHPERVQDRILLCLHGFGGSSRTFRRLALHLPDGLRMWSVSLPWHGDTQSDRTSMQLESYTHALAEMLKQQKHAKVIIMAHSFGARIAAMFALLYPERTSGLYLIAPGGYYPPEDFMFRFLGSFPMRRLIKNEIFLRPFVNFLIPGLPDEKRVQTTTALRNIGWSFPAISLKARGELFRLKKYPGKTILIVGEKDRLLKASYAPKIAQYYSNCTVEVIRKSGHLPMVTHPKQIKDLLLKHSLRGTTRLK